MTNPLVVAKPLVMTRTTRILRLGNWPLSERRDKAREDADQNSNAKGSEEPTVQSIIGHKRLRLPVQYRGGRPKEPDGRMI
jgi:hypothetical protein